MKTLQEILTITDWEQFSTRYGIETADYFDCLSQLLKINCSQFFPLVGFPDSVFKNYERKFYCEDIHSFEYLRKHNYSSGNDKEIHVKDLLKSIIEFKHDATDLAYVRKPSKPIRPSYEQIVPKTHTEYYNSNSLGKRIGIWSAMALICGLPLSFFGNNIGESIAILILYMLLWVPSLIYILRNNNETVYKAKKVRYTKSELAELEAKYERMLCDYHKQITEYPLLCQEYERIQAYQTECLKSYQSVWSKDLIVKSFVNSQPFSIVNDPPQRGRTEDMLFYELMKIMSGRIKVDAKLGNYYPDLVITTKRGLTIDVEIDEPYDYKTHKEIHYVGSDDNRNAFFNESNWVVVRFSESQILNNLSDCVSLLHNLVWFIDTLDIQSLYSVSSLQDKLQTKRWTKEEARVMSIEHFRG